MTIDRFDFKDKRAFVRVDFNVPLNEDFHITDDTRIRGAIPTIQKILSDGGAVILASHMGRPKGVDIRLTMGHVRFRLADLLGRPVDFVSDCISDEAKQKAAALKPGQILLLENIRFYEEEEGKPQQMAPDATAEQIAQAKAEIKSRQPEFARQLASLADCYVNDAFGTAHRKHVSTALIADFFDADHKMFGYLMEQELGAIHTILQDVQRPFTAIMGGSKVSSKIDIIEALLDRVDVLILAGGMSYTFAKAFGGKIGLSICEDDKLTIARQIVDKAEEKGVRLILATDAKVADAFSNDARTKYADNDDIPDGWEGMDIGPKSMDIFRQLILQSKTILWNGPVGVFEFANFAEGSRAVAEAIAEATDKGAYSLIGGGDSVACVNEFGLADRMSYVSTGGGALLEAIEGKALPGVTAIQG